MEDYINNIVADIREYMKANPKATPENAWHHVMDVIQSSLYVEKRENLQDAEKFARKALEDNELQREARNVTATTALDNHWREIDAMLYLIVCLIKHDEILQRVKELAE